jgi:hypothetical protein
MVVAFLATLDAQDQRGLAVPDRVRQAQAIVAAANVELREEPVTWAVEATEAGLTLAARRAVSPLPPRDTSAPLVTADVTLDARGELLALQVRGTLLEVVRQKVADGTRPTAEVLAAARAKYPPSDSAAADSVVPDGVVTALGGRRTGDVQFREQAPEAPSEARTWRAALDGPDVSTPGYTVVIEPVEGRLVSVVRR